MVEKIRSLQNERVKSVVRLIRESGARRETGLAAVEGTREIERAMAGGWIPREIYVSSSLDEGTALSLVGELQRRGVPVFSCAPAVLAKMAYREHPDGVIAVGPMAARRLDDIALREDSLVLVVDDVEKPGNLGALLRTADAVGADAVVACGELDLGNPNLIRASVGTVFYLPIASAAPDVVVRWLRDSGLRVVAAEPEAELSYVDADLAGPLAVVVGAEDEGLREVWKSAAELHLRIPMRGRNDSLNVSVAAAILLYEVVRQRGVRAGLGEARRRG